MRPCIYCQAETPHQVCDECSEALERMAEPITVGSLQEGRCTYYSAETLARFDVEGN